MIGKKAKRMIVLWVCCAALLAAAIVYSLLYNGGRWVAPMDLSRYVFSVKDLPMLAAGGCVALCALYTVVTAVRAAFAAKRRADPRYTRTVSPLLGWCGLLGFLGFGGFWTYQAQGVIFPFIFFVFFGFFGLFFEGKLSHTLQDEMFEVNRRRAQLTAYKAGFALLFAVIWLVGMGMFSRNVEWCAIFMLIAISLIYALVLFLSNYLLYRYEKEE